jgi:stage IV sporulation protein FB
MDGGRVLRALLALRLGRARATMIAARVGRAFAVALGLYGLWSGNVILVLIAAFVWIGSGAEAGAVAAAGRGSQPAGSAMRTSFEVLAPADPRTRAVDLTRAGPQKDFPVLAGDQIAGVLTQAAIRRGLHDLGPDARVAQLMTGAATADVATPLAALLEHMRATGTPLVLVTRDDRLAGIVDLDSASASLRRPRRR